jgi:hypothetical protein
MAVFSGEVTIRVKFNKVQIPVGFGMTSSIIKHKCVEQAYATSPWSKIKHFRDERFEVTVEKMIDRAVERDQL